jgi:hypothetical protein
MCYIRRAGNEIRILIPPNSFDALSFMTPGPHTPRAFFIQHSARMAARNAQASENQIIYF